MDDTLFIKNLSSGAEQKVPRASRVQFSDDSKWIAYFVAEAVRPTRPAESDTPQNGPARLELRNLATGSDPVWDNVASFAFSKGSSALMMRKARPARRLMPPPVAAARAAVAALAGGGRGGAAGRRRRGVDGTDLILHHLRDGGDELIGSVSWRSSISPETMLAYTVSAADRDGNGLFVLSTTNWQRRSLDKARADYTRLTWDDSGTSVAALRGTDRRGFTEKENAIVAFVALDSPEPASFVLDRKRSSRPGRQHGDQREGHALVEHGPLEDLRRTQRSRRRRRRGAIRRWPSSRSATWTYGTGRTRTSSRCRWSARSRIATGRSPRPSCSRKRRSCRSPTRGWIACRSRRTASGRSGRTTRNTWTTGSRSSPTSTASTRPPASAPPMLKGQERSLGLSPDGKYFLYWKDKQVWSYDIAANKHVAITQSAPVSFVNAEEDHVGEKPAYGVSGFTKDGKSVVLDHKYDLWLVSLDGSGAPQESHERRGIQVRDALPLRPPRARRQRAARPGVAAVRRRWPRRRRRRDDRSLEARAALGVQRAGQEGRATTGSTATSSPSWCSRTASFGRPIKAKNADRVLFTRETFAEFPDYWVTNSRFENPKRLTEANPQQAQFKWGHRVLFDYKDKDGHKLQGTLAVPDDYQPGQKLPMLVYFYEKLSDQQNHYEVPRYASAPQYADYVSNGYLVMLPDIYFHTGRSHTDMLNSVEAAVKRVEDLGLRRSEARRSPRRQLQRPGSALHLDAVEDVRGDRRSARRRWISSRTSTSFGRRPARTSTATTRTARAGSARIRTTISSLFMDQSAVFHARR